MRVISNVDLSSIIGEVGQNDTKVDETGENTGAKTPNRRGCYFRNINGAYHRGLSDAEPSNKAAGVDSSEATPVPHEDTDTQDP